jgi:hypothetical protein
VRRPEHASPNTSTSTAALAASEQARTAPIHPWQTHRHLVARRDDRSPGLRSSQHGCLTRNGRCSLAGWPRRWPSEADEESLDAAHEVRQFAGRVKVMTRDLGMQLPRYEEGLEVLVLPEERPSGDRTEWSDPY